MLWRRTEKSPITILITSILIDLKNILIQLLTDHCTILIENLTRTKFSPTISYTLIIIDDIKWYWCRLNLRAISSSVCPDSAPILMIVERSRRTNKSSVTLKLTAFLILSKISDWTISGIESNILSCYISYITLIVNYLWLKTRAICCCVRNTLILRIWSIIYTWIVYC